MNIDASVLLSLLAAGEALFFDYFPWVAKWFDALAVEQKRLLTLVIALVMAVAAWGGTCQGWFQTNLVCTLPSLVQLGYDVVLAVAVLFGFHMATKPSTGLKARLGIAKSKK